ncbi:MAG: hypothetical protein MJ099_05860 [Clostridia bacterium]|nr:hypothetical protein [Clostridia bacterium]
MANKSDKRQAYFERVRPLLSELFGCACLICGNTSEAEFALQTALLAGYLGDISAGMSLREGLKTAVRKAALRLVRERDDDGDDVAFDPMTCTDADPALFADEKPEVIRSALLVYGCGLSVHAAASLTDSSAKAVTKMLEGLTRRRSHDFEQRVSTVCRNAVHADKSIMPSVKAIAAEFIEAVGDDAPGRKPVARILSAIVCGVGVLVAGALFWIIVVLLNRP